MSSRRCFHYFVRRRVFVSETKLESCHFFADAFPPSHIYRFIKRRKKSKDFSSGVNRQPAAEGLTDCARHLLILQMFGKRQVLAPRKVCTSHLGVRFNAGFSVTRERDFERRGAAEWCKKTAVHTNVFDVITAPA